MFMNEPEKTSTGWNSQMEGYELVELKLPGYMVYSVGNDLKDNGGTPKINCGRDSDITFTVLRRN